MAEIYMIKISDAARYSDEYCLNHFPVRYARAAKFKFPEDRLRCLGVGILLYGVLGLNESDINVTEQGKPISDRTNKKFSIAHSGEYTVLAVSDVNIGVDIELIDERHLSVTKKVLTGVEREWIEANPTERFFTLWTLKESISKAIGCGLSLGFEGFSALPLVSGNPIAVNGRTFYGQTVPLEGYGFSICTESKCEEVKIRSFDYKSVL